MALTPIIDTIISLFFLFFFFSVLVSCIQEGTVPIFKTRGKMLSFSIDEILNDKFNKNFGYLLYQHPQIDLLKQKQGELPSYIEPSTFSKALIDLIAAESIETVYTPVEGKGEKSSLANKTDNAAPSLSKDVQIKPELMSLLEGRRSKTNLISTSDHPRDISLNDRYWLGVESLQNSDLKKLLQSFLSSSRGTKDLTELEDLEKQIEEWYKGYMERVTGWYKRKIRTNILFASIIVTLVLNLNFIVLAKTIYASGPLRQALSSKAQELIENPNALDSLKTKFENDTDLANIDVESILGTKLPIGWDPDKSISDYTLKDVINWSNIFGWLIFALALSRGAPFWFDVLKKFVNVRNNGLAPGNSSGS